MMRTSRRKREQSKVVESLGRQLLRRLRRANRDSHSASVASVPAMRVDADMLVAAIQAARSGGSTEVTHLALLLIATDQNGDDQLGARAADLLVDAGPTLWKNLDLASRRIWWATPEWANTAQEGITRGDPSTLARVVASFHPVGFVREAAVARLGESSDDVALPALALRSADWVPQVRDRARIALAHRVSRSVDALLGVGPLAVAIAGRAQGGWLFDLLEEAVAGLSDSDMSRLLAAADWRLRRSAYSIALRDQRLNRRQLLQAAEHDGDLVIRVRCADAAIRDAVANGEVDDVRSLAASGTAAVRASAVSALARAGNTNIAIAALRDRNPMVREVAQAAVRRAGQDPAEHYRELLRVNGPSNPGVIAGLGETGTSEDVDLIRLFLEDPAARCRVEAVRALRRLGSVDVPTLVPMLDDPSAAVTRQVSSTLQPVAAAVKPETLEVLLENRQPPHVRTAAYRLLCAQDVWTRLLTDLELYQDDDERMRARARGDLLGWLDREAATTYSMPNDPVAVRLDTLIRDIAVSLGPNRERALRFHLGLSGASTVAQHGTNPKEG